MEKQNRSKLTNILPDRAVKCDFTFDRLRHKIRAGGGRAERKTLNGHDLTAEINGLRNIVITGAREDIAHVSTNSVRQSNGMIQVVA